MIWPFNLWTRDTDDDTERVKERVKKCLCSICQGDGNADTIQCPRCLIYMHSHCLLKRRKLEIINRPGQYSRDPASIISFFLNPTQYAEDKKRSVEHTEDAISIECYGCNFEIGVHMQPSPFRIINKGLRYLRVGCILVPVATLGALLGVSFLFSISGLLIQSFKWVDDFFTQWESVSLRDLASFSVVPQTVYSMSSTNVGVLNLIASCGFSWYGLGIPLMGASNFARLLQMKLAGTILYRLTLNRYYFTSFKKTPPALFGNKIGEYDSNAIQSIHNEFGTEEETTFAGKVKVWFSDFWTSLRFDFGVLYKNSFWDAIQSIDFGLAAVSVGVLCQKIPQLTGNPFLSDSQNAAYASLIGMAVYQGAYFLYSNYKAIRKARSLNNIKVGGEVDESLVDYMWSDFCQPLLLFR